MSDTHPIAAVDDTAVPIPVNARALFAKMAAFNDAKHAAEAGELQTVHELCLAYNTVDEDAFGEAAEQLTYFGAQGTPPVAEYLSLEISALLGMAPGSGACMVGRVLNCVYRHPLLWDAVQARTVRWNRAVDVIEDVTSAGLSLEAAHKLDQKITPLLMTMPRARTRRILAGLIALADPAQAHSREEASRDQRGVSFFAAAGSTTHLIGRLDLSDAIALDDTLGRLATTLATLGDTDSLDIRRATAMGILADPARALTMLTDGTDTGAARITEVILHLAPDALTDGSLIGRAEGPRTPSPARPGSTWSATTASSSARSSTSTRSRRSTRTKSPTASATPSRCAPRSTCSPTATNPHEDSTSTTQSHTTIRPIDHPARPGSTTSQLLKLTWLGARGLGWMRPPARGPPLAYGRHDRGPRGQKEPSPPSRVEGALR